MSETSKILRDVAKEARAPIERMLDDAEILAGLGRICRDNDIDWSQLKALIKAQIRDDRDESGEGGHVESIINRADAAQAYADILSGQKNISDEPNPPEPAIAQQTTTDVIGASGHASATFQIPRSQIATPTAPAHPIDHTERDGIPAFLDRRV